MGRRLPPRVEHRVRQEQGWSSGPEQALRDVAEANRRQYLFVSACELPVLLLALVSLERRKKLFWLGWGIHAAFTACVVAVVIWLDFFWHW